MLTTQDLIEEAIADRAQVQGIRVTADKGHEPNIITYRAYDSDLNFLGSVTLHYEENFASFVNYASRDSGDSYRYGKCTTELVNQVLEKLKIPLGGSRGPTDKTPPAT
jgi:hypothetical protein